MATPARGARFVATFGFAFGSLVSIAANVLAERIPPAPTPLGWTPALDAQLGAPVWPIALLLAVEALTRIPWPKGLGWLAARYLGVTGVAVFAGVISYFHIHDVLVSWRYQPFAASVGPLVIDGLMVVSGVGLMALAKVREGESDLVVQNHGLVSDRPVERSAVRDSVNGPVPDLDDGPAVDWTPVPSERAEPVPDRSTEPVRIQRRSAAASKTRTTRTARPVTASVPTDDEISAFIRTAETAPTKRSVMSKYGVGSGRALRLINEAKEAETNG
jgi:hypothetical protein